MQHIGWVLLNILFFFMNTICDKLFFFCHHQMTSFAGNHVDFGVFEIYGGKALSDALDVALKMNDQFLWLIYWCFIRYVNFFSLQVLLETMSTLCVELFYAIYMLLVIVWSRVFTIVNMMFSLFNKTLIT